MSEEERQPDELSFEDAMESLESIVSSLEGERLPLEEMLQSYERGVKLLRVCRSRIETARQRVEIITADLEGRGKATLSDFGSLEVPDASSSTSVAEDSSSKRPARKKPATPEPPSGNGSTDEDIRLF
jgi:exodeoxyribonuclease VII small subunit